MTDVIVECVIIVEVVGPRYARPFAEQNLETLQGPSRITSVRLVDGCGEVGSRSKLIHVMELGCILRVKMRVDGNLAGVQV